MEYDHGIQIYTGLTTKQGQGKMLQILGLTAGQPTLPFPCLALFMTCFTFATSFCVDIMIREGNLQNDMLFIFLLQKLTFLW